MMNVDAAAVRKVSIAMYEGEINMIIHAYGGTIDVDIYEDRIVMCLKDTGPGIANIEEAMQEGFSTAPADVINLGFGAGMGLPNMRNNSDEFNIESEVGVGTTVTMTVYFSS
ncbi:MAG: ATP-binding protein [Lachnospiraceae bacterium]|nr:ATP-binding protein [Lachnospiraceae bacterium]MCR4684809.1 ATP-binding protein [Lachnospiraceae bacterium]